MIAALVTAAATAAAEPERPRLLVQRSGAIVRVTPDGSGSHTLLTGAQARWSPDGTLTVFVRGGDLWTANSDGTGERRILATPNVVESNPVWTPDGKTLVYEAAAPGPQLRQVDARGGETRRIAASSTGEHAPAISRDGRKLAFVSARNGQPAIYTARADGSGATVLATLPPEGETAAVDASDLEWSPDDTTIAFTVAYPDHTAVALVRLDGTPPTLVAGLPAGTRHPVWSPDGTQLALDVPQPDATHQLWLAAPDGTGAHAIGTGVATDWRPVPLGRALFPDLAQRAPRGLVVSGSEGRYRLGFTSLADNRGPGILWIRGRRAPGAPVMDATQLIQLAGGGVRLVPHAGALHYTVAPPHYHWHWLGFDRYELRNASNFQLVVRDRKSGFCIADHYGLAPGVPHGPPRFLGSCGQFDPRARSVEEGSSVGYTDRYPANFHGQNLDITHVAPGLYWLVHRVNSQHLLRELRYDNDAASLLVRISWPGGRRAPPRVAPLRACPKERC